jgi:hypothetical protein
MRGKVHCVNDGVLPRNLAWASSCEILGKKDGIATISMDNKSAIQLCKNPVFHNRSKHIETWFHFISECANGGKIDVKCIVTKDQLADILARALGLRWCSLVL